MPEACPIGERLFSILIEPERSSMATKGPKLKVSPFEMAGDRLSLGRKWKKWLDRFERDLLYNGIDAANKDNSAMCHMALLMHVGGDVEDLHDVLADVQKPAAVAAGDCTAYAKSKAKLNGRFLPKQSNDFSLCELMSQKAKEGESMLDYAARLRGFADRCDFTDWSDKMIKCMVIASMKDVELRLSFLGENLRLDQVLDKIQMKEDATAMGRVMSASGGLMSVGADSGESVKRLQARQTWKKRTDSVKKETHDKDQDGSGKPCWRCGRESGHPPQQKCFAATRKCNLCGTMGHYGKMCTVKSVKLVDEDGVPEMCVHDYDDDDDHVEQVNSVSAARGRTIAKVNGVQTKMIIDTRSSVNIVDFQTYVAIGQPELGPCDSVLYPFGLSEKLPIMGKFTANVEAKGKVVSARILVMKGPRVCNVLSEKLSLELGLVQYIT